MNTLIAVEYAPFDCWTDEPVSDWAFIVDEGNIVIFREEPELFGIDGGDLNGAKLPLTVKEFFLCYHNWKKEGTRIVEAFPMLDSDALKFLLTGLTPEVWNAIFKGNES